MFREDVADLRTNHEEADTLICRHVRYLANTNEHENVLVRASDTDVAVILISHASTFSCTIWMDVGTQNNRRFVNISAIANAIGVQMSKALPGFHAYTGTDYTAAFYKKGKKRPF